MVLESVKPKHLKMPLLSDVLRMIDRNRVLTDLRNKYYHQVTYNNSRTILKYIESNVILSAYAYNPGNAVVIFPKKNGLIAYSCYFDGFPDGGNYSSFHWSKLDVDKAIALIRKNIWEQADLCKDTVFENNCYMAQWENLAIGKLAYTSSYRTSTITISEFKQTHNSNVYFHDYSILRLNSGRLRVEVDGKFFSYEEFLKIIQFYREHQFEESIMIIDAPDLNSWQKVLSIDDLEDNILDELKVQTISKKIKEAA